MLFYGKYLWKKKQKTIEDQGKKQVKALENLKLKEQTKTIEDKSDDKPLMQEKFFNRLLDERMDEIQRNRQRNWF